ncbi:uncharacterized protein LY89DRAFT_102213 [Mollisia scopiformis]|uniref:Uncharacterized protein n=1 Tax=Mollisia scopiformis TaxID=149040 RepID=A0A194X7A5_MOLSC|nr:uncharacterized protein LY89DRAFT_102213 [Mollisia scopiformis]KUJ16060.1 hypothetical protein LY89DRAFT_102213 [Mollisia scopiformis]
MRLCDGTAKVDAGAMAELHQSHLSGFGLLMVITSEKACQSQIELRLSPLVSDFNVRTKQVWSYFFAWLIFGHNEPYNLCLPLNSRAGWIRHNNIPQSVGVSWLMARSSIPRCKQDEIWPTPCRESRFTSHSVSRCQSQLRVLSPLGPSSNILNSPALQGQSEELKTTNLSSLTAIVFPISS